MFKSFNEYPEVLINRGCYLSKADVDLKESFRLLWEQHVYWTRMTILGIVFDLPDSDATTNRLLRNPDDFAMLLGCYYGKDIASEFSRLLKDHLVIAAELVKAAKAGNNEAAADAERKWFANADAIVGFLHCINPCLQVINLRTMWYEHLRLTKEEAVAELTKNYTQSIAIFDQIEKLAMMMADDMANGISRQFHL